MKYSVVLHNKSIQLETSLQAEKALRKRDLPIVADVHLIFGCMIAKRVWFKEQVEGEVAFVSDKLKLAFHTVRYTVCSFDNIDSGGVPEPFLPSKGINKFMPPYVFVDYQEGEFIGEFSLNRKA